MAAMTLSSQKPRLVSMPFASLFHTISPKPFFEKFSTLTSMANLLVLCFLCQLYLTFGQRDSSDVILSPLKSGSKDACIIMTQGAGIEPSAYVSLMQGIQQTANLTLWVGIPGFLKNYPEPLELNKVYSRITKALLQAGMPSSAAIIYAGHSLGGVMVQSYVDKHVKEVRGQVLFGAYLTRAWKQEQRFTYPLTTLTVGGELDGLTRVSRLAEAYYTQITTSIDPKEAAVQFPVVVLPGVTHMQFASGEPTSAVAKRDLQPELSYADAHAAIAATTAAYLETLLVPELSQDSFLYLSQKVQDTKALVAPMIEALFMEGYHNFLPPCDCKQDICPVPPPSDCTPACPWTTQVSQAQMGVGQAGLSIVNQDGFHKAYELFPYHHPQVYNSCKSPQACVLNTSTVTEALYHTGEEMSYWRFHLDLPSLDAAYSPISARELKTKLMARATLWEMAGVPNVNWTATDGQGTNCMSINQLAYDFAWTRAPDRTVSRFKKYGQPYVMGPDRTTCLAAPCWIWKELQFEPSADNRVVVVTAPSVVYQGLGFHFCKLLSPARAMEWLYVDGLRAFYSLSNSSNLDIWDERSFS
eukprot:g6951.t1